MNQTLRSLLATRDLVLAPMVFNGLSARLAPRAGFEALYLGGGTLGYLKAVSEANLALTEFTDLAVEIRSVCPLPLIMDGGCGWGEPMHMVRTVAFAEAAGFAAIEIEDQVAPKRAHHHIGVEHLVPTEVMTAKIAAARAARSRDGFLIIARTNACRTDVEDAVRRSQAYHQAGADLLFPLAHEPTHLQFLGERLPAPLMQMTYYHTSFADMGVSHAELSAWGYRLLVDGVTPSWRCIRRWSGHTRPCAPRRLTGRR
jgi:methylisocitrate lyase